jgi:5,10-methylenetetrahydromethanopterin reductase
MSSAMNDRAGRPLSFGLALAGDKPLAEYVALAQLAERYAFDTLSVYDDLLFKPAWPILMSIAPHTKRLRLGPAVVNPYLTHPAVIAANLAMLDEASNGRAYLGVGRGAFLDSLQLSTPKPITAVRETIQVVRHLLAGERTSFQGRMFQLAESAFFRWQPPRGDVPILVGAWGEKMCQLGGELANEVKAAPLWNPDGVRLVAEHVKTGAAKTGRDPAEVRLVVGPITSVAADRAEARAFAARSLAIYLPYLSPMTDMVGIPADDIARVRQASVRGDYVAAASFVSDNSLDGFALWGTPRDCIERIERMVALTPVDRIDFGTPHGPNEGQAVRLIGEQVLPHFSGKRA